ncbi:MAG: hypothetical protein JRJ12_01250 [Deltaproteobacteria bacterium]|nr:hypothetical protein [Deltaproteobacteria bacterium]
MKRAGLSTDRFEIAAWNSEAERPLFKGLSFPARTGRGVRLGLRSRQEASPSIRRYALDATRATISS